MTQINEDELKGLLHSLERSTQTAIGRSRVDTVKEVVFQLLLAKKLRTPLDSLSALDSWSIAPELGIWIFEYIVKTKARRVVELGSGVSTVVIAEALRRNGGGRVLSIEHSEEYFEKTCSLVRRNGLEEYAQVLLCPLADIDVDGVLCKWYSIPSTALPSFLGEDLIDLLLVDGPPAATQKLARFPAIPVLGRYLDNSGLVILDDCARDDEIEISQRWVADTDLKLECEVLAHMRRSPALLYSGESPMLSMQKNHEWNMTAINHDKLVGPMTDYVAELVKRDLLRLEVAEGIALKHQLLLQSEGYKYVLEEREHERAVSAALSDVAELQQKNTNLESQVAHLHAELNRWKEKSSALEDALHRVNVALAEGEEAYAKKVADLQGELDSTKTNADKLASEIVALKESHVDKLEARESLKAEFDALATEHASLSAAYEAIRAEKVDLEARCESAVIENGILSEKNKRYADDLEAETQRRATLEKKQTQKITSLIGRTNDLMKLVEQLRARNEESKARMLAMKASIEGSTSMNKEVFSLVDTLQRDLMRVTHELEQAQLRLYRTKNHLSYRLGGVLVNNSGSLRKMITIPSKLIEQKRDFQSYKKGLPPPNSQSGAQQLVLHEGTNYSFARTRWRTLSLDTKGRGAILALTVLSPQIDKAISIELHGTADQNAIYLQSEDAKSRIHVGQDPIEISMLSNGEPRVIEIQPTNGVVRVGVRKIAGGAGIIKIHATLLDKEVNYRPEQTPALLEKTPVISNAGTVWAAPKPMKSAIIWQASQMMGEGRIQEAIAFAKQHARDFVRPAVDLLVANSQSAQEDVWLGALNSYLKQFGVSPVSLASSGESRFLRLESVAREVHSTGPLISVIMPAFNSSKTIGHAIRSILNQSWKNLELFVIDDASEDDTWQVVQQMARQDSRIKAFRNARNVGPYVSKNLALQYCRGKYITGHDADDWAHPDRLASQVGEILRSDGQMKGNMARMIRMMADGTFVHFAKEGKTSDDGVLRDAAISCMFERDFFSKHLGHWDCVRFGADSELISRAQKVMQHRFVKVRHMSMICLDNEGSLTNDPIHGVSKTSGISPTRKFYRDQWTNWHASMEIDQAFLPFPYTERRFAVPDAAAVHSTDILENIRAVRKNYSS